MVHAREANHSVVSIPCVASRRVNFDTPPLKGCCTGTWVPVRELVESHRE